MGSPQDAALQHFLNGIRATIKSLEADLTTASVIAKPDIELLISFLRDTERNATNELELHRLTHGGIEAQKQACAHPERYITNAPAPPLSIHDRGPQRPRLTREEQIARKKEQLESELQKAEARSSELKKAVDQWYLLSLPEWDRVTADAMRRWTKGQRLAIERYGASKLRYEQMLGSQDRVARGTPESAISPLSEHSESKAALASQPSLPTGLSLRYRSDVKRAILMQLTRNPDASDREICRALDADGALELPRSWKSAPGDRLFFSAYRDPERRPRIEKSISKIRTDLRKRGLLLSRYLATAFHSLHLLSTLHLLSILKNPGVIFPWLWLLRDCPTKKTLHF